MILPEKLLALLPTDANPEDPPGSVSVLNVHHGDMKFSFDPSNPDEVDRARAAILDMLKRGYMLFVDCDGTLHRVTNFDPSKNEYVVRLDKRSKAYKNYKDPPEHRIPAAKSKVTAVAPTAGG